jgi:hypothetical protein
MKGLGINCSAANKASGFGASSQNFFDKRYNYQQTEKNPAARKQEQIRSSL